MTAAGWLGYSGGLLVATLMFFLAACVVARQRYHRASGLLLVLAIWSLLGAAACLAMRLFGVMST